MVVVGAAALVCSDAAADVLCKTRSGSLKVRAECRRSETVVDGAALGLQGPPGPTGPEGAQGVQGPTGSVGPLQCTQGYSDTPYTGTAFCAVNGDFCVQTFYGHFPTRLQ